MILDSFRHCNFARCETGARTVTAPKNGTDKHLRVCCA